MPLPPSLVWRNINLKGKGKSENIVHHFLVLFLSNHTDQWWKMKWQATLEDSALSYKAKHSLTIRCKDEAIML